MVQRDKRAADDKQASVDRRRLPIKARGLWRVPARGQFVTVLASGFKGQGARRVAGVHCQGQAAPFRVIKV